MEAVEIPDWIVKIRNEMINMAEGNEYKYLLQTPRDFELLMLHVDDMWNITNRYNKKSGCSTIRYYCSSNPTKQRQIKRLIDQKRQRLC